MSHLLLARKKTFKADDISLAFSLLFRYKRIQDGGLQDRVLPLSTLPSVAHVVSSRTTVLTNDFISADKKVHFEDWELQHSSHGVRRSVVRVMNAFVRSDPTSWLRKKVHSM